ncbi:MAG: glycoside hydrolase family 127 protein [Bacteroidaceae bacterium]|nr:glycoside hydrolase family 127 protein [Bacteroidaceae bacterium]
MRFPLQKGTIVILMMMSLGLCACRENDKVSVTERPLSGTQSHYSGFRAPLKADNSLLKLPVGSIHPEGWLKRWLELQREGLCGQLGTVSEWLDKEGNQWLGEGGSHGWEEVPYWLRGYSNLAYLLNDEAMIAETKTWIEAVISGQREDGFIGPANAKENGRYEVWPQMIMLWILQDYYEFTGDKRVLDVMTKYFHFQLTQPDDKFLEDYWENSRGGDNMWSVIWLYNRTGDKTLLPLIDQIHRNTANWTQHDNFPNWHGVNIAQGIREPATYWLYKGDEALLKASYRDQELIRERFGQVPGGMYGADENCRKGYIDPRQGAETCAMVEQMASDEIMMTITGDPTWAENCEDVAFNTLPVAFMPDFRSLRYFVSPNMPISDAANHYPSIENAGPFLCMNPFSSRCCQHNHGFGWPYYAEYLTMATSDGGLATMLYCASETKAIVGKGKGHEVVLRQKTHYPFEGVVSLVINTEKQVHFPLYLRIPSWAKGAEVSVNGKGVAAENAAGKYVRIERTWKDGDEVVLNLPMEIFVRTWEANKNSVSVNYGPLTLSLKIAEKYVVRDGRELSQGDSHWQKGADVSLWPTYEIFPGSPWNYSLLMDEKGLPVDLKVVQKSWPADDFPFTQESVPLEFTAVGCRVPSWGWDETGYVQVLPDEDAPKEAAEPITLIPMGAARLRISAFPTAK